LLFQPLTLKDFHIHLQLFTMIFQQEFQPISNVMNHILLKACVPLGVMFLFSGCIDSNYDLSDIDTTTEIKVNDLTLPVKIDPVKLSDIITIDANSKIKIVDFNGQKIYAVTEHGDISSEDITINGFTAAPPTVNPTSAVFNIISDGKRAASVTKMYDLYAFTPQDVRISAVDVDKSIHSITSILTDPIDIAVRLTTTGFDDNTSFRFPLIKFKFLKGLTLENKPANYDYDPASGMLTITDLDCTGHEALIAVRATGVNFVQAGLALNGHRFDYDSKIELDEAKMELTMNMGDTPSSVPTQVSFNVATTVSGLKAIAFTGMIEYDLEGEGLDIDPVDLSDIPDFLADDQTDLRLANPQIYIGLNNPMADSGVRVQTGLRLVSVRPDSESTYDLDPGELVRVTDQYGVNGPYNFVISPSLPADPLGDYKTNLSHVGFKELSNVLSGNGLPSKIEINLVKPELPLQPVTDFRLFTTTPGVVGTYDFFAPLALKADDSPSVIVYRETKDGWNDEDVDKIAITSLTVQTDVQNDIPLDAELSIHPIDKEGNRIPGVEVSKALVAAGTQSQHVSMTAKGDIRHLDGVVFEAVVHATSEETLSPSQSLTLSGVSATVSGSYTTDF